MISISEIAKGDKSTGKMGKSSLFILFIIAFSVGIMFGEEQVDRINIDGQIMSEDRHQGNLDAQKRAEEEVKAKEDANSTEAGIIEAFDEEEEEFLFDDDGTAKEKRKVEFNPKVQRTDEDLRKSKSQTYKEQDRLDDKKGFADVESLDEDGNKIDGRRAKKMQEERLAKFAQDIGNDSVKKSKEKNIGFDPSALAKRAAATRKAEQLIKDATEKRLENE